MSASADRRAAVKEKLNTETAKVGWSEIKPHYKSGALVIVSAELDLVDIGAAVALDEAKRIEQYIATGEISKPTTDQADAWANGDPSFWCSVVAPFVLIQPVDD